jgi:hypothetical protein
MNKENIVISLFLIAFMGGGMFVLSEIARNVKAVNKVETITNTKTINVETEVTVKKINSSDDFEIVTIDGCEYIVMEKFYSGANGNTTGGITHKGNCKYCARSK